MPKIVAPKTSGQLAKLTKTGLYAAGGVPGLHLQVTGTGGRSWILRAIVGGIRRDFGLGSAKIGNYSGDVPLEDARKRAIDYKAQIREGIDPAIDKAEKRAALIAEQRRNVTFKEMAIITHNNISGGFRNKKHRKDWISSLERYAFPHIGNMRVIDITNADVQQALEDVWLAKPATAKKLLQRMELVLDTAKAVDAKWGKGLRTLMAKQPRQHGHHKALKWKEVPAFLSDLRKRKGTAPVALQFAILTGARSGEVRGMTWDEIDLDERKWTVPASRMKAGKQHVVPLSDEALAILRRQHREDDGIVFKATRGGQLSDMALSQVCRRMEVPATPHGFRSSFKNWAREKSNLADEVSELCLAHVDSNSTRAAYARGGLIGKRREMLQDWAHFCSPAAAANVTPIRRAN